MKSNEVGHFFEDQDFYYFFGNKNSKLERLRSLYLDFDFRQIHQTHSDICVESSTDATIHADAHWTREVGKALSIRTADCIPVLISSVNPRIVSAIHAGWRGVANRIVIKSIDELRAQGCKVDSLRVYTGPCIQFSSFEVRNDVLPQILSSVKSPAMETHREIHPGQFKVDLLALLHQQLFEIGLRAPQIISMPEDTMTNLNYVSYRRDSKATDRQLSFIALKNR